MSTTKVLAFEVELEAGTNVVNSLKVPRCDIGNQHRKMTRT
jgi:hypothetical protein